MNLPLRIIIILFQCRHGQELKIIDIKKEINRPDKVKWPWKHNNKHVYIKVGRTDLLDLMTKDLGATFYRWDYRQIYQDQYHGQKYIVFPNFDIPNFHNQQIILPFFEILASGKCHIQHKSKAAAPIHPEVILILMTSRVPSHFMGGLLKSDQDGKDFARIFRIVISSTKRFIKTENIFYHQRPNNIF